MNLQNDEYRDTRARTWTCTVPVTVQVTAPEPIDLDAATELAVLSFTQNQEVLSTTPGPDVWVKLWTEANQDEVVIEDVQEESQ